MFPYIHIGSLNVPTFGLMLWLAAVVGGVVMDRNFRRTKISADAVGMVAITVLAGIIGAKLWHVLDTRSEFPEQGWRVLWGTGGFASFGGVGWGMLALVVPRKDARGVAAVNMALSVPPPSCAAD